MKNNNFTLETNHDQKLYENFGLTYAYGIYAISKRVAPFCEAIKEAIRLKEWLNDNNGSFHRDNKYAYAISHCQVAREPYAFFVVCDELINSLNMAMTKSRNKTNFFFPKQEIFNAKILVATDKIKGKKPERVPDDSKQGYKIVVKDGLVPNKISVPDSCMSFPLKRKKNVEIFYRIRVQYQIRGWFGFLITKREWVEGLKAHVFQHEINHANGINMYYGKAKSE